MNRSRSVKALCAALLAVTLGGCRAHQDIVFSPLPARPSAAEETAPLGGEALARRRYDLTRAGRDMTHFRATLESLRHRRDRSGAILFGGFLDAYMGLHLDPMLNGEWQSRHPELMAVDAQLRLVKAELLIKLRDPRRAQEVMNEIEKRFAGRENMLVEYPVGERGTLADGLAILREKKWRG